MCRAQVRPLQTALFVALLFVATGACRAQSIFTVHLDTSSLIGHADGPFSLDFQLNDGAGIGDGNNTATLSNFDFGTGAASGAANAAGGASGNLMSGITITDTSFVNELFQEFAPGNVLTFDVTLTGNADAGLTPDAFSFAILDSTLAEIPTTDAAGALLTADIYPDGIDIQTFAGDGAYAALGAPRITTSIPGVPEPGMLSLLGTAGVACLPLLRRRKR